MNGSVRERLVMTICLTAAAGIGMVFLFSGQEERERYRARQDSLFNVTLTGRIGWMEGIGDGRNNVYYLQVKEANVDRYDARDSAGTQPYAVVQDSCAAVVEPGYIDIGRGDRMHVDGETDSVFVYRADSLVYADPRSVSNYGPYLRKSREAIDMDRCRYVWDYFSEKR
jgi:hypothetical protein